MTIPWLMNCAHQDAGWCIECVAAIGAENARLREAAKDAESLREALVLVRDFPDAIKNGGMTLSDAITTMQAVARAALTEKAAK